jgi:hypothetical protein
MSFLEERGKDKEKSLSRVFLFSLFSFLFPLFSFLFPLSSLLSIRGAS